MTYLKISLLLLVALVVSMLLFSKLQLHQQTKQTPVASTPSQGLSQEEYTKIRDALLVIVDKQNPRVALETLREEAASSEAITRSCHDLTHEIGHAAYDKYKDFATAMQYQDEVCNSGYLHGIIESHFAKAQDIFATMKTVCNDYDPAKFIGWECFHGVGHGLMYYTENDLPKSLSLCDAFDNASKQEACINGVFMENFNVDQKNHISKYVRNDNSFYPCSEEKQEYKSDCYLYAPTYFLSLHPNEYKKALDWCKTAEKEFRLICTTGVGSQAVKEHINNPTFVESVCMEGSENETNACITGMVGLYINHFGGLKEAKELCTKLAVNNQATCEQTIASEEYLF